MSENKLNQGDHDEQQFLKKDFFTSDYLEFHANVEKAVEQNSDAIKQVYAFAHKMNTAGRMYSDEDIRMQCELHYLNIDKVKKAFETVFRDNKEAFGIDEKSDSQRILHFINKNFNPYKNIISGTIEVENGEFSFPDMILALDDAKIKHNTEKVRLLLDTKKIRRVDPFKQYFENLDKWDGQDHIKKLCSFFKTDNDDFFEPMLRKMLVRSVRCGLGEHENRFIMVLCGKAQEIGKSSFIRWINPMGDQYYFEGLKKDDKDMNIVCGKSFIVNLDELNQVSKYALSRVKEMISMKTINERQAFRRDTETMKRRCNFFGTSNEDDFLVDSTNSRWLVFTIHDIDYHGYLKAVEKNKIWAQAYYLYKSELFDDQLTADEKKIREERNRDYQNQSIEYELISKSFVPGKKFMSTSEIITLLQRESPLKLNTRYIAKEMERLGIEKKNGYVNNRKMRGYLLDFKHGDIEIEVHKEKKFINVSKQTELDITKKGTLF